MEGPTEVRISGMPTLLQMLFSLLGAAFLIISTLGGAGAVYLNKSLEAQESRLNDNFTKVLSPIIQKQAEFKLIIGLLVSKVSELTPEEKKSYSDLLSKISYEDIQGLLKTQDNRERKSLDSLIKEKRVVQVRKVTGLTWDGGNNPAQVRYFQKTDPTLDLSNVDLYSEGDDPCQSRVLELNEAGNTTVQVCEAHLSSSGSLELVVVTNFAAAL
jgi:hypothetical protein